MANEAVIIELLGNKGDPVRFTCASGTAIAKGTLLKLSGDNTVSASAGNSDVFAGIAAAGKSASDFATTIAVYTFGKFDLKCGPPVSLGNIVSLSGANLIKPATEAEMITGDMIGKALEAGDAAEVIAVRVLV